MFKTIEKYPQFEVNENGEVKNKKTGNILKMNKQRVVKLSFDGKETKLLVAITVARLFIPNPENFSYVGYKDGNNMNVKADNLLWVYKPDGYKVRKPEPIEIGSIINGFKILNEDYEQASHRIFEIECVSCSKTYNRTITTVRQEACSCTKERCRKPIKERNWHYLKNGAKKLIKHIDYKNNSIDLLCRICRGVKTYSIENAEFYSSCCAKSAGKKKNNNIKNSRLKRIFHAMKNRCYNQNCKDYKNYGSRGIDIYKEWLDDSQEFYKWALKNGYKEHLSIDRRDNDQGYNPENCRWIPLSMNCKMNRHTKADFDKATFIRDNISKHTIAELSEICEVSESIIDSIIKNKTWIFEQEDVDKYLI